ncbi:HEPN domain-containing protein [Salinibacterium sp. SWN248]|uniref:HEPN domain-containing protein n=1 Tax=Salinibacterium sp. SWN248 TaxID=2792056 RepID=UPI0035ABD013
MIVTPDQQQFGELVESWWKLLDEEFPAPQVITTYLHLNRGLREQSTASALAATENIHSSVGSSDQRFPPEFLNENRARVKVAFPGADFAPFREFLYEKFQENRPTLDTRLQELVEAIGSTRMEHLEINRADWIKLFKRVRNKLAHTGAHVPRRGDSGEDLKTINAQTRAILTLLILARMGIHEDALDRSALVLGRFPHRSW